MPGLGLGEGENLWGKGKLFAKPGDILTLPFPPHPRKSFMSLIYVRGGRQDNPAGTHVAGGKKQKIHSKIKQIKKTENTGKNKAPDRSVMVLVRIADIFFLVKPVEIVLLWARFEKR